MPRFRDKANFYKIHPSLPAKNKILNLMNVFVCFSTSLTACSKKVFFSLQICSEMPPKWVQDSSCSVEGMKLHLTKNLRFCSLFYMFRAFRIHFDINFSVRNNLKKCIAPSLLPTCSWSKNAGIWAFLVLGIWAKQRSVELYTLKSSSWDFDRYWEQ